MDKDIDKFHRSAVTNGALWIVKIDQRSALARRFRDLLRQIEDELHWPSGQMPLAEQASCRRLATMLVMLEMTEADLAAGRAVDQESYLSMTKAAGKLSTRLGLELPDAVIEARARYR